MIVIIGSELLVSNGSFNVCVCNVKPMYINTETINNLN